MRCTPKQIVQALGGTLNGDGSLGIERIASLASALPGDISFLSHTQYAQQLTHTQASCVILSRDAATGIQDWLTQGRAWIETESPTLFCKTNSVVEAAAIRRRVVGCPPQRHR